MGEDEAREVTITIDRLAYTVEARAMLGCDIRAIPHPPIPPDRDLWLNVPSGPDRLVNDNEPVEMEDGFRLFTTPRSITAGSRAD